MLLKSHIVSRILAGDGYTALDMYNSHFHVSYFLSIFVVLKLDSDRQPYIWPASDHVMVHTNYSSVEVHLRCMAIWLILVVHNSINIPDPS